MTHTLHVITGLEVGGAEITLVKLVGALTERGHRSTVVSLTGHGSLSGELEAAGAEVVSVGTRAVLPDPGLVVRVRRAIARWRPDVVQTWLYHADLVGGLAAVGTGVPVVWGVHQDAPEPTMKAATRMTARACARLSSRLPAAVACCSTRARDGHAQFGYRPTRFVIAPNGFDTTTFRPVPGAETWLRTEIGAAPGALVVGMVGRLAPIKGHATFFAAACRFAADRPDVHVVLAGPGVVPEDPRLRAWVAESGIGDRCHLLGPRRDVPRVLSGLDVAVVASLREGFGNAVAEALACGVPVVATDTGAARDLTGGGPGIVPPGDADCLAAAVARLLDAGPEERRAIGAVGRRTVEASFGLDRMATAYLDLWASVAPTKAAPCRTS